MEKNKDKIQKLYDKNQFFSFEVVKNKVLDNTIYVLQDETLMSLPSHIVPASVRFGSGQTRAGRGW